MTKRIFHLLRGLAAALAGLSASLSVFAAGKSGGLTIADPYILFHGGRYYAYGTGGPAPGAESPVSCPTTSIPGDWLPRP